jgi:hypothetical protein
LSCNKQQDGDGVHLEEHSSSATRALPATSNKMVMEYTLRSIVPPPPGLFLQQTTRNMQLHSFFARQDKV